MKYFILFSLLVFPAVLLSFTAEPRLLAFADEEDDADDVDVEGEDTAVTDEGGEDEEISQTGASPDADTTVLFTKPIPTSSSSLELPAGQPVEFLVGFHNNGKQDFILETLEASFRYPMDFTFYIQNFSMIAYNKIVKPTTEATLAYTFLTPETFAGRPFGLNVHLNYRDLEGNLFGESVFNETINVVELDEGLDGETFFLYLFLAGCGVLLLVVGQQFLVTVGKKRVGKKPVVETGTSNPNDVDYGWLPKEMLNTINKTSPKSSPRASKHHQSPKAAKQAASKQQSPRQRKAKRSAGRDD